MTDTAFAEPAPPDSARPFADFVETIRPDDRGPAPAAPPDGGRRLVARVQALLGLAAVALSLAHCVAVLLATGGGGERAAERLLLGVVVLLPGALVLWSRREVRARGPRWRAFVGVLSLLAVTMAQSVKYEATFPVLFALAAAWQLGWLLAARLVLRSNSRRTVAPWVLLPPLVVVVVSIVGVVLGLSFAEIET